MNPLPQLAFLSLRSPQGQELLQLVIPVAQNLGFQLHHLEINEPAEYAQVCAYFDAVILDASIEEGYQHNYRFVMPSPVYHVLVVSRTQMPLNFYGSGDAYPYEQADGSIALAYNSPLLLSNEKLTNRELLYWIKLRLAEILEIKNNVPQALEEHKDFFKRPINNLVKTVFTNKMASPHWQLERNTKQKGGQIFISFRNRFEGKDGQGNSIYTADKVMALKRTIESGSFSDLDKKSVRFFPPNSLSNEIMSTQRRWQILSMIDRYIGAAEEFWIYETEEYYNSWWTLGELLTLAYRDFGKGSYEGDIPKIKIFKPNSSSSNRGKLIEVGKNFLPDLSKDHKKRMARWYVNSDPSQMAPEAVVTYRGMQEIPFIRNFKRVSDPVWSREFWEYPILDCPNCRKIGVNKNQFNVDSFLWHKGTWFASFSPEEIASAIHSGKIACPNCKATYQISLEKSHYYWIPPLRRETIAAYYLIIYGFEHEISHYEDLSVIKIPTYSIHSM